ncbi:MAG: UDP-N-acetylglucosamine 1-carboxyvinyltransferase [Bacilli bacterium]
MQKIKINGGNELNGLIKVSGDKNSVVALLPAAILSDEEVIIDNVPNITDTDNLINILKLLNCEVTYKDKSVKIDTRNMNNVTIPKELSKKLRASYYFMGAMLSKYKKVEMYFPGGCNLGARPINFHIKGFEELGAKVTIDDDKYTIEADELKGANIYIETISVGTTINLMLAATKAKGVTIISNAAKEPQVINVASLLNNMGAKISGAGTTQIRIEGVDHLSSARIEVIPDRIEASTYMIAGALLGKELIISGIIKEHIDALYNKLKEMGADIKLVDNYLIINASNNIKASNIKTTVFPGIVTDMGQPLQVLLTQANGTSVFEETIYEQRMKHVPYLKKMGADIEVKENKIATINGPTSLHGEEVEATDLRAGAAMVIAGLIAKGTTTISSIEHILRGYENIVAKLQDVGADIEIIEED